VEKGSVIAKPAGSAGALDVAQLRQGHPHFLWNAAMPVPTTVHDFLALVHKSTLLDPKTFDSHVRRLWASSQRPTTPAEFAKNLIGAGMLTPFQAELLLEGKWRGFTLGRYKVMKPIGAGGMGKVYLCEHRFMRRQAALKVLPPDRAANPADLERFYREARAVAALDHPNIVRAYDIDQEGKLHFLAMEYVEGATLQQIVQANGPLSPRRAAHFLRQVALGLHHVYEHGVVHRDVKPANLVVDQTGIVKLLDLGLARFFTDEVDDLSKKHDEVVLGTADFVAPEQSMNSHHVDVRADIYSLGATFYYCLTGSPPFPGGTMAAKMVALNTRPPRPIGEFRSDVPPELVAIIDKMMAKERDERFETPADVALAVASLPLLGGDSVALDTIVMKSDSTLRENNKKGKCSSDPRDRWLWIGGGVFIALLLLFVILLLRSLRAPAAPESRPSPGSNAKPAPAAKPATQATKDAEIRAGNR
jgi:eukaryotic-like serine/threonine-protein kinase